MPAGTVNLKLVGGNTLLDTLVGMGLIPEDQAMGARMMTGMFARPGDGEDTLVSTIEMKEDGSILANGQRIKLIDTHRAAPTKARPFFHQGTPAMLRTLRTRFAIVGDFGFRPLRWQI